MGELRQDPLTGEWTIVEPKRGQRPGAAATLALRPNATTAAAPCDPFDQKSSPHGPSTGAQVDFNPRQSPSPDAETPCPFCPGLEFMTHPAVREISGPDGWQVRIVPNKYPAVSFETSRESPGSGKTVRSRGASPAAHRAETRRFPEAPGSLFRLLPARGHHEVVVETPHHHLHPADMKPSQWVAVLRAWRDRSRDLAEDPRCRFLALFRNYGSVAGASQPHPHSQLMALPHVPPAHRRRWRRQKAYHQRTGRCLLCDLVTADQCGDRLVWTDAHFTVLCPFAPAFPYEAWIVPTRHAPCFHDLTDAELYPLAEVLIGVWNALRAVGDPPHNLIVHNGPLRASKRGWNHRAFGHWYIQIAPRITTLGGFEVGTGMTIVSVPPEEAARLLKEALEVVRSSRPAIG